MLSFYPLRMPLSRFICSRAIQSFGWLALGGKFLSLWCLSKLLDGCVVCPEKVRCPWSLKNPLNDMAIVPSFGVAQNLSGYAFSWFIVVDYNVGIFYTLLGCTLTTIPLHSDRCCGTRRLVRPAGPVCSVP